MKSKIVNGNYLFERKSAAQYIKINKCQTPEGVTLKKLQFDKEKKRVILKPLNPDFDVIIIEDFELETFRILGEMVFLFRVV